MGNLIEAATWSAGIPYFEADAILTGGPDCPDNIPIQALTNRTAFLKKQIDDAVSGALTVMYANRLKTARTITMSGDGTWSVSFDGNGNVTGAMTLKPSVALSGVPTAPTAVAGTNTTQIASTAFVQAAIAALVASSPAAMDTLNELAAALGNDPNFATSMTNLLAAKAPLASPPLTGVPTAPTAAQGNNSAQIATTAFVRENAASFQGEIAGGVDLNTLGGSGFYVQSQNAEAASGTNYPVAKAGMLESCSIGSFVFQRYHVFNEAAAPTTANTVYARSYFNGAWSAWQRVAFTDSPAFTGTPTVPTAVPGTNNTQAASTAFVQTAIAALIAASPAALDTLNELSAALGNDPNFATTVTNSLAAKAPLASPGFTGQPKIPLGSAATPGLVFVGDTDTGLYSLGADQIGLAVGGVEALRFDAARSAFHKGSQINALPGAGNHYQIVNRDGAGLSLYTNASNCLAAHFDATGRLVLGGGTTPAAGYTGVGDVTLPVSANIRALNTCKAWAAVNPTTGAILEGVGFSTVTRVQAGLYTCTLANVLANNNYGVLGFGAGGTGETSFGVSENSGFTKTTSAFQIQTGNTESNGWTDAARLYIFVFGRD